jgi:hypothetical protein
MPENPLAPEIEPGPLDLCRGRQTGWLGSVGAVVAIAVLPLLPDKQRNTKLSAYPKYSDFTLYNKYRTTEINIRDLR